MSTAEIVDIGDVQTVTLPSEFHIDAEMVSIRREGEAIILEPLKAAAWPEGFFAAIHIDDPMFSRSDQGQAPAVPPLG